jgi:hypothetical protein
VLRTDIVRYAASDSSEGRALMSAAAPSIGGAWEGGDRASRNERRLMKWVVGAIVVVSVAAVVRSRRKPMETRSTWTRATDAATSAASAAANGVKSAVTP